MRQTTHTSLIKLQALTQELAARVLTTENYRAAVAAAHTRESLPVIGYMPALTVKAAARPRKG